MKISSKSILSPGGSREPSSQISLSSSFSRRLRSNGSMKGGQASPMFPTTNGKKRGAGFENPEPSSPKVTCIGQVRVKTKKQGKKFRACRSKRRGEVGFRNVDHNNNGSNSLDSSHFLSTSTNHHQQQQQQKQECKKWVHLPVSICEALRTFGSEFNCFLPCRSSCMAKEGKTRGSCGFTRWLVAVQEGQEREIEMVVDDVERRESSSEINEIMMMMTSSRKRHVFEDIEINDLANENMGDDDDHDIEEGEARVSICIPPKNALLLMRCRSDPVKMAALANKFWETPLPKDEHQEDDEVKEEEAEAKSEEKVEEVNFEEAMEHQEVSQVSEMFVSREAFEEQQETQKADDDETEVESVLMMKVVEITELVEETQQESSVKEQTLTELEPEQLDSSVKEQTLTELEPEQLESTIKEQNLTELEPKQLESTFKEQNLTELENEAAIEELQQQAEAEEDDEEEEETNQERSELYDPETRETDPESESKERESQGKNLLPDCLLLMMREPKLSMEVSKETWVCSTDFIRWVPDHRKQPVVKQKDGGDEPKRRISVDSNPPRPRPIFLQPPRSSCSFPAAPPVDTLVAAAANAAKGGGGGGGSMTTKIEYKHVGSKGYESFALTRCKSEPRRSSAKLATDAYCWKNRKFEPTSLGVGAAGVGF